MSAASNRSAFWRGYRDCSPFILVIAPFGLLFGAVSADAGLNLLESVSMSLLVLAGAAQFTAVQLLQEQAPTFVVILAALAVNLRMALYSAALVPHIGGTPLLKRAFAAYFLVDQVFAASAKSFEFDTEMTPADKLWFIFGAGASIWPFWMGSSMLGFQVGASIPVEFSLDFAIPICFIAITAPMMRSLPHMVSALVSIGVALLCYWMPYYLWLITAAVLAMMAGAQTELWLARRAA